MTGDTKGPYKSEKEKLFGYVSHIDEDGIVEVIDPETRKRRIEQQRLTTLKLNGAYSGEINAELKPLTKDKKTKALTTSAAKQKDFDKVIVYCPICSGFAKTNRMYPHELKELQHAPELYAIVTGGLPFEEDAVFLHCSACNLRLMPQVDEVEKLDALAPEEYIIESIVSPSLTGQVPIMAASKDRYNKNIKDKDDLYKKRRRQAMEKLSQDYSNDSKRNLPNTT